MTLASNPAVPAARAEGAFEAPTDENIPAEILSRRICDFDLRIEGQPLGRCVERFREEIRAKGITRLVPSFYLTGEWGVPEGTVAIGIPFYLADDGLRPRVVRVQGELHRSVDLQAGLRDGLHHRADGGAVHDDVQGGRRRRFRERPEETHRHLHEEGIVSTGPDDLQAVA